jgi:hypothetical protein
MEHKRDTLEHQFFNWESWDQVDTFDLSFSEITLKVAIGNYPVGTKFPHAALLVSQSLLVLVDEQDQQHVYPLVAGVGPELPQEDHADGCGCGHEH